MKKFIDTVVEEFGRDEGKEVFVQDIMERLDELSAKHDYIEIFHYTANEVSYDDKNVLDFLEELDINSVEDKALQEVLRYLNLKIETERDILPSELVGEFYNKAVEKETPLNAWTEKLKNDKNDLGWER